MVVNFDELFDEVNGFITSKTGANVKIQEVLITEHPNYKLSEIEKKFNFLAKMNECFFEIEKTPNFIAVKMIYDEPIKDRTEQIKYYVKEFHERLDDIISVYEAKYLGLFLIANYPTNKTFEVKLCDPYDLTKITNIVSFDEKRLKKLYPVFETETRRGYISDLYLELAKFSIMIRRILDKESTLNIALTDEIIDKAPTRLYSILDKDDKKFLDFFHSVRNSIIHYAGNHNLINKLDYTLSENHFYTNTKNLGTQIIWSGPQLRELKIKLQEIFMDEKILNHPFIIKKLS